MDGTHVGQVVVATGAGRGIGRTSAEWFASAGAHVTVSDIDDDVDEVFENRRQGYVT
ncbi:MAG TPA: hypothetical protein QGI67_01645 [Acidimicrobiales bacterium]|jgi:NAD(P)-dependent dehydrogenase (short-subunit alcohol dehydrogenase family)|nr:hypothetical protein [Acidimicrobiales bacterium]|tara:strand:+ start:1578 stop:1748 length:171 start_codon:yes stop_codon:yes gene_type:complete